MNLCSLNIIVPHISPAIHHFFPADYSTGTKKIKKNLFVHIAFFSTDIIVGFPGETAADVDETIEVVREVEYDNAFTFIFSPRVGTPAAKLEDKISLEEKEQRLYLLNETVNKYFLENNQKLLGKKLKVLVEGASEKEGMLCGYTETNKLINFVGEESLIGKIVEVEVTDAKTWSLDGKVC